VNKLYFTLGIILSGLTIGYVLQLLVQANRIRLPIPILTLRRGIQKVALWFFTPVPIVGAIWLIRINDLRIAALPFIGIGILLIGGLLGWSVGRIGRCSQRQIGALYCCGSFSNIASMGSLVAYIFIGEKGFALLTLFKMFEEVVYYGIGFPIAKYYGAGLEENETFVERLRKVFTDPFVLVATGALLIGASLNFSGIPRPAFYENVNAIFIPTGVFLLLISIGLGLRLQSIGYFREVLLVSGIKFVAMPVLACMAAILLGMQTIYDGLPLKAILLASSMPVAFNAVVASSLYDLDLDLANSCWLITTGGMVLVLPCLYYLLGRI
jgi:predicted permease